MSLQPLKADHILVIRCIIVLSLPSRERGLKLVLLAGDPGQVPSLPSRERGLKSVVAACVRVVVLSLPSRERGLKSCGGPGAQG